MRYNSHYALKRFNLRYNSRYNLLDFHIVKTLKILQPVNGGSCFEHFVMGSHIYLFVFSARQVLALSEKLLLHPQPIR